MKNTVLTLFLLLFLSCQDNKEIESEIFQPSINWDLNNTGAIDINEDDLKSSLEKIIYFDDLRSIGIIYNNQFIFEHYNIGDTTSKFPVYSITKSVLSAIFGQLIDQKIIEDEYDKINKYLDLTSIKDLEIKTQIQIDNLLSMNSGIQDDTYYIRSNDPIRYILDKDLLYQPGDWWNYSSAGTHVLSAIFSEIATQNAENYAKEYLFGPLGITDFYWQADINGLSNGGWGLSLRLRDMLKFGNLYVNKGKWYDTQLISRSWIEKSTSKISTFRSGSGAWDYLPDNESGYGYLWWVNSISNKDVFSALGYGGQYIILDDARKLVIAIASRETSTRNYRQRIGNLVFNELITIFPKLDK
tara:strand:+ start:388 stop:1458 length:1071 start_codon:yes stop_codon:yes gene_type:complete